MTPDDMRYIEDQCAPAPIPAPDPITFFVPGKPKAWQRARMGLVRGRPVFFKGKKQVSSENLIFNYARLAAPAEPWLGPVWLDMTFCFAIPPSWPKWKQKAMIAEPHASKPDRDNLAKAVQDVLRGLFYHDDAQVADGRIRKLWVVEEPRSEITARFLPLPERDK